MDRLFPARSQTRAQAGEKPVTEVDALDQMEKYPHVMIK